MSEERYLEAVARHYDVIRTGAVMFDFRTGQCGPAPANVTKSWGSACPDGYCPPANLPDALGRYFAGDRSGCREVPYTLHFSATEGGVAAVFADVTVTGNSKVTMCPTRMLITHDGVTGGAWRFKRLQFGNQNQVVGDTFPVSAYDPAAFQAVPFVPDCLRAGMPYEVVLELEGDATPVARQAWVTLIGPMVG
jgi:hypothetical protein